MKSNIHTESVHKIEWSKHKVKLNFETLEVYETLLVEKITWSNLVELVFLDRAQSNFFFLVQKTLWSEMLLDRAIPGSAVKILCQNYV